MNEKYQIDQNKKSQSFYNNDKFKDLLVCYFIIEPKESTVKYIFGFNCFFICGLKR